MQEDIINSVLEGKDTLALLPTGGGKSICFQIPTLVKEGLNIVVTPLIALMKDQVENLKRKGIKAVAIYSGMHPNEIEVAVNNCTYNNVKFLYLSPERLETDLIKLNIEKMKVSLLTVDEAHCISQWGYDFRPHYLKIADFRKYLPNVPVMALTATATPEVVQDIQQKLAFSSPNVFQGSFERKNLTYVVLKEENKLNRLLKVVNNLKGSGIVYMRSRKKTVEIAQFLQKNKITANYYHAGLDHKNREVRQNSWMHGKTQVMVATNAFGMGIDKPNVRFVVHLDITDSLEAYFQEAGRAGRDEKRSYAVLLYEDADIIDAKNNLTAQYPELKTIRLIYQALGNFYQLAIGSGKDVSFDFEIFKFCSNYNFKQQTVYNSLKFLEKEGYILLQEIIDADSKIHLKTTKEDLYKFQVENAKYDKFIKVLLRSYSGLFTEFVKINENAIAKRIELNKEQVEKYLQLLEKYEILTYVKRKQKPQITFLTERQDSKDIYISDENYRDRKKASEKRLRSVLQYVSNNNKCRSQQLLEYFGETNTKRCGRCDVCIERNKIELSELEFDIVLKHIKPILKSKSCTVEEIAKEVKGVNEDKIIKVVQWLLDNDKLYYDDQRNLSWRN
ncbi:MAG: RecQ family ATP-dependent DNA helicase [Bacteroidales bacterium]|nr:RecQ family ATP-dependent DNA helicase [Bacteroidales bacterium]